MCALFFWMAVLGFLGFFKRIWTSIKIFDVEVGLFFSNFFTLFELSSDGHNPYLLPPHTYTYTYTYSYKPYCEFPSTLLVSAVPLQYPLPVLMHSFEAVKNGSILWTN